jgi:hypothetical protein
MSSLWGAIDRRVESVQAEKLDNQRSFISPKRFYLAGLCVV